MVQNFTRDILPRKNIIFAQIHKSAGMLLQYSGAALMRNGLSNSPVVMGDQVHNPSGHTHTGVKLGNGLYKPLLEWV